VKHDPAYGGREMHYQAIRAATLFAETKLRDDDVIQFRCLDGFVASISKERIMRTGPGQSLAYIAIENPKSDEDIANVVAYLRQMAFEKSHPD
jgi:hypothetical protein